MKGVEIVDQVAGISAPAECLRRLQRCFYVHNARRYDRRRRRRSTREAAAQREMAEHEDFLGLLDAFESLANVIYPPLPGSRYHCARCSKLIAGVVCKGPENVVMHWGCAADVTGRPKASSQPVVRGRVISNFSAPDMLFLEPCLEDLERRFEQLQQHISGPSNGCVGAGNVADLAKKRAGVSTCVVNTNAARMVPLHMLPHTTGILCSEFLVACVLLCVWWQYQ